ncbi:MAG: LicD family protein [Clostridia bacterium]|nr:LicD family protein [Clostridia bacterium]
MNQFFYDEIKCSVTSLKKAGIDPTLYKDDEIIIVSDEHTIGAYLAGFFTVGVKSKSCSVCVVAQGKLRNEAVYNEFRREKDISLSFYSSIDEYIGSGTKDKKRHIYYIANLQLNEYENEDFVKAKKENMEAWLQFAGKNSCSFVFIPVFNFSKPFEEGVVSVSEREIEAVAGAEADFVRGRLLMDLEELCRKHFGEGNMPMNVVRFDNIFGPMVEDTTKLGIDKIIDELAKDNKVLFKKSDSITHYTGCYIREAITAVYTVSVIGKNGNIYNAANYNFTLHDIKDALYTHFASKNPAADFDDDLMNGWVTQKNYECLANLKIQSLGWTEETPFGEAIYRTALIKVEQEYKGDFYVDIYQGKIDRIKRIEMDIMREIDRICRENDINYFLVGGSLLGAIRHKGFIPWDDDIDIGMLREDFEKFRHLCPKVLSSHLSYQSYTDEPTSHYIFDKVRLKDTYFSTKFSNRFIDIENGIFIDILVYDKTANSSFFQKLHINSIRFFRRLINIRWVGKARRGIHYTASKIMLPIMKKVPFLTYHYFFEKALQMFDFKKNSRYLIDGVGQNLEKGPFPMEWFEELIDVPYEDMVFKAPKAYDAYLRHWYGARYMELLPLSSRNSGHALARLDLGRYLYKDTEGLPVREVDLNGELFEKPVYVNPDDGMDENFLDEISLIDKEILTNNLKHGALNKCEINVIGDEHALAAYLAGYYMFRNKAQGEGNVNVILEGKCRNKKLYDQISEEFDGNALFNIYDSIDNYYSVSNHNAKKVYFYLANIQLDEYADDEFVREKKNNLRKWLALSRNSSGTFVFIPIFNFKKPFDGGVAAISEREVESIVLYEKDFRQGRILMELEDVCRKSFSYKKNPLNIVRFDNIFGPFVEDTSKLGIGRVLRELKENNSITFCASDNIVRYSACYIRQAVTAVHCAALKGRIGNIYNASNYNFTLHDIKTLLYEAFAERNPAVKFISDTDKVPAEKLYERLGNLKLRDIGWTEVTPLDEALARTVYAELEASGDDKISQTLYQGKLNKIRRLQLEIIADVDRICRNNSIRYFLVGGSLLGAVKYGGYIPWEDTIDIGMFREDYEKFKAICPKELSDKLKYQSYEKGSASHFVHDKIRLNDTGFFTAVSENHKLVDLGLFINVYVYDKTAGTTIGRQLHAFTVQNLRRLINLRWQNKAVPGPHYKLMKLALPFVRLVPFNLYHTMLEHALKRYSKKENCVFLIDGEGLSLHKGAFPAKWFYNLTEMEFEGVKLPVPEYYDDYLKHFYGENYMKTIPESKRHSGRKILRIDLGKYLYDKTANGEAHRKNAKGELYEKL